MKETVLCILEVRRVSFFAKKYLQVKVVNYLDCHDGEFAFGKEKSHQLSENSVKN